MDLLKTTLPRFGLKMPGSQFAVISGLQINRLKLSFWKPGALENNRPIPALQRKQIDICIELGHLAYFEDPALGFFFASHSALLGTKTSSVVMSPLAMAVNAVFRALFHPETPTRIKPPLEDIVSLARKNADTDLLLHTMIWASGAWLLLDRPVTAAGLLYEAQDISNKHHSGALAVYGSQIIKESLITALWHAGDFKMLGTILQEARAENLQRGSLLYSMHLDVLEPLERAAADCPMEALKVAAAGFHKVYPDRFVPLDTGSLYAVSKSLARKTAPW